MSLTPDQVRHLARLTRLGLDASTLDAHADAVARRIALFAPVTAIDADHVEPMVHPPHAAAQLRPDAVTEVDQRAALQQLAPATADGLYLVPKVIE